MRILKITKQSIKDAVAILKQGGTVVYPTETAYALGCDAINASATRKIFKIKKRPKEKNLPVICATKKQVEKFFQMPPLAWRLWLKFYPKPLSVILFSRHCEEPKATRQSSIKRDCFASLAMTADGTPVRISSNKTARDLARKLGRPIVSTSANVSGEPAMYDAKEIATAFSRKKNKPDLILDAGKLPHRSSSTIVKISKNVKSPTLNIEVMRQGEVKI